jgi:basic membrane protein A
MRVNRWIGIFTAIGCAGAGLLTAGCPKGAPGASGQAAGTPTGLRAALAIDTGGVDDKSFNAASWAGLQRAGTELNLGPDGVKYVEAHEVSDYGTVLSAFATQNYGLVIAGSYSFADALKDVAPQFPAVKFAIIDADAPDLPNCESLQFRSQEAAFLAGYVAARVSKTGTIGFVGGKEGPLIATFLSGYTAGARTASPNVRVLATYAGAWDDVSKGKSQATQQFASGADVVLHVAGKTGLGVIEAAKEKGPGFYAIGCDQDQDGIAPGNVLTSVLKRVDVAVADTVKRTKAGQFTPGKRVYGLKDGGVGITEMKYSKASLPPGTADRLAKLSALIIAGKIVPPTTDDALAGFQPPKL